MTVPTALRNFRISAWITGIGLIVLVFVAMPLKYFFDTPGPVAVVGVTHGFLYMIYIVATLLLAERVRAKPLEALVVLLAGTIPIASFVAERVVTNRLRDRSVARQGTPPGAAAGDAARRAW